MPRPCALHTGPHRFGDLEVHPFLPHVELAVPSADYGPQQRVLERVTIVGDRPR